MHKSQVNAILESFKDDDSIVDIIIVRQLQIFSSKYDIYDHTHYNNIGQVHWYPSTQENHAKAVCDSVEKELRG